MTGDLRVGSRATVVDSCCGGHPVGTEVMIVDIVEVAVDDHDILCEAINLPEKPLFWHGECCLRKLEV